jgi:hypothetical protein
MRQKNFSKSLAARNLRSSLRIIGDYAAKFLPKSSLAALLLTAVLFPSRAMAADYSIPVSQIVIPESLVYNFGEIPSEKTIKIGTGEFKDKITIVVSEITRISSLAVVTPTPANSWPYNQPLMPGDFYQVTYTITPESGWSIALTSGNPWTIRVPAKTDFTHWASVATSTAAAAAGSPSSTRIVVRVAYKTPSEITSLEIPANGAFAANALKVGEEPASNTLKAVTGVNWTGAVAWTPAVSRFTANKVEYTATVTLSANAGYTFYTSDASGKKEITWASGISAPTKTKGAVDNATFSIAAPSAKFAAFSQYPARKVTSTRKPVAGELATGLSVDTHAGWINIDNLSWDKLRSGDGRFLPDSVYRQTFTVEAAGGAPAYGFFGLAADYYTPDGPNVTAVTHRDKSVWVNLTTSSARDTITITYPKTAANPASGNVVIPRAEAGKVNTLKQGDALQTTIAGAKAYFERWATTANDNVWAVYEPTHAPGLDSVFKAETVYRAIVKLVAKDDYTFYYINNTDREFAIADSVSAYRSGVSPNDTKYIQADFKTEALVPGGNLAVPHPIAGLKAGERAKLLPTGSTAALVDALASYKVLWFKSDDGTPLGADDVFAPATKYTAKTVLVPKAGYTLYGAANNRYKYVGQKNEQNPTYNPANPYTPTGAANIAEASGYKPNSDTLTVAFYQTAFAIDVPEITPLVAPVAGAAIPAMFNEPQGKYAARIEWSTANGAAVTVPGEFVAGTEYVAKITVEANTQNFWSLAGLASADFFKPKAAAEAYKLVSKDPIAVTDTTNYAVVTYKFAKTAELITIKEIAFQGVDFIYPTTGWTTATATANVGIAIPQVGDTLVNNDQYVMKVEKWENKLASASSYTAVTNPKTFTANKEYLLTLRLTPKEGWTVWGLDGAIPDLDALKTGTWAAYIAGGAQVKSVKTWANTLASGFADVQILFDVPAKTVVAISGFPNAGEGAVPAAKAGLTVTGATIDELALEGQLSADGKYLSGETYVYTLKVTPEAGYTTLGLAKDRLNTTVKADSVKHAVNSLNELKVYYTTPGKRIKDFEIEIGVPAAGEKPAATAKTSEVTSTTVTWTGNFDAQGRFIKGNTYSVTVVLDNASGYSYYGVPKNAFKVKNYPHPLSVTSNHANDNVVTIQFPTTSSALVVTAPLFDYVPTEYGPILQKPISIKNNTAATYVIDDVVVSGNEFALASTGKDTIAATGELLDWQIAPATGLSKGEHSATITVYYHVAGLPTPILYTDATVVLRVSGLGVELPETGSQLRAFGENGVLTVKGLAVGEPFSVHNAQGIQVYRGIAKTSEATVNVPVKGIYIVTSGNQKLKTISK